MEYWKDDMLVLRIKFGLKLDRDRKKWYTLSHDSTLRSEYCNTEIFRRSIMRLYTFIFFCIAAFSAGIVRADDISFIQKPRAAKEGDNIRVTFELSAPVDIAAGVINKEGIVVRHLGGGMLGENAPEPFKRGSLSQSLVWDRKDDRGDPVPEGKYRIRIRAGIKPGFERIIGYEPLAMTNVLGLTVGRDGELFVMNAGGVWVECWKPTLDITVYTRDLEYKRTVLPCPGDLEYEKVKGIDPVVRPDGRWVPKVYHGPNRIGYNGLYGRPQRQGMAVIKGNRLLFTHQYRTWRLLGIDAEDGRIPDPFQVNAIVLKEFPKKMQEYGSGNIQMAVSKDGTWVYMAGLVNIGPLKYEKRALHALYRYNPESRDPAVPFIGKPKEPGSGKTQLKWPKGVAVDGEGNILVSDSGNDRIAVFSSEGSFQGEIHVNAPDFCAVDRKRGTVYAVTGEYSEHRSRLRYRRKSLVKIKGWKDPQVLGEWTIGRRERPPTAITLDDTGEHAVLWFSDGVSGSRGGSGRGLWRIIDTDPAGALPKPEHAAFAEKYPLMLPSCEHIAVDPITERIYVSEFRSAFKKPKWYAFDGKTGKPVSVGNIDAADLRVGYDGHLYGYKSLYNRGCFMVRWDRDGKPVPFEESGLEKSEFLPEKGGDPKKGFRDREGVRGFDMAPNGDMYVLHFTGSHRVRKAHGRLSVVGSDGKIKKPYLLKALTNTSCSARLDPSGNIYIIEDVIPKDSPPAPPGFVHRLVNEKRSFGLRGTFGSVVKFPPSGGAVYLKDSEHPAEQGAKRVTCRMGHVVDDSMWIRPYASPIYGEGGHWCFCFTGRMDIDRYGRLFVPVAPARQIEVLDTAGNHICFFGRYGNIDNAMQKEKRKIEGIPVNWPGNVAVSDGAAYISDTNNRCVIKVKLDYTLTETVPVL